MGLDRATNTAVSQTMSHRVRIVQVVAQAQHLQTHAGGLLNQHRFRRHWLTPRWRHDLVLERIGLCGSNPFGCSFGLLGGQITHYTTLKVALDAPDDLCWCDHMHAPGKLVDYIGAQTVWLVAFVA